MLTITTKFEYFQRKVDTLITRSNACDRRLAQLVNSAKQGKKVVEDIVGPLKTKYKKKLYAEKLKSETVEKP